MKGNWMRAYSVTTEDGGLTFGMHWGVLRQCPLVIAYRGRIYRNWIIEVTMFVLKGPSISIWRNWYLSCMDCLLTNRTSAWFLWAFGKEQLSVTASRGVSLMPQLKTAKPAGARSTVPFFTCLGFALIVWPIFTCSSLRDRVLGQLVYSAWSCRTLCFSCQRSTNTMSQGQDSLRATDTIYIFPFNGMIQPGCCPCVTYGTIPCCTSCWSAMDLLRWAHLFLHEDDVAVVALLGVWEVPTPPVLYQQLAQWNTNIPLRI